VSKGFTLIELLVVTAIIVLISSVVLANNNRFGGVVLLQNLAYNIALSIRQAQVYGISTARFQSTSNFSAGYGMHFDLSSPDTYLLFADAITPNGMYDCPQPQTDNCELVQSTNISNGYGINQLCVTASSGAENCSVQKLDVLFKRPEPDAWISADGTSCTLDNTACQEGARIVLIAPSGDIMNVTVEANGQISVSGVTAAQ
jgi:prepilin-type N-terminal cleavage/methylation domain-containing protein